MTFFHILAGGVGHLFSFISWPVAKWQSQSESEYVTMCFSQRVNGALVGQMEMSVSTVNVTVTNMSMSLPSSKSFPHTSHHHICAGAQIVCFEQNRGMLLKTTHERKISLRLGFYFWPGNSDATSPVNMVTDRPFGVLLHISRSKNIHPSII